MCTKARCLITLMALILGLSLTGSACTCNNKSGSEEEVGPSGEPQANTTGPVISDVAATNVTAESAVIVWSTDQLSTSQVEYGLTDAYESSSGLDTGYVANHTVVLEGLSPGTPYHFRVLSTDQEDGEAISEDHVFTTDSGEAPAAEFLLGDLKVTPAEVWAGEEATVSLDVTNIGELAGVYTAVFRVDGQQVSSDEKEIEAGVTEPFLFTVLREIPTECEVEIDGKTATLVVKGGALAVLQKGDEWTYEVTYRDCPVALCAGSCHVSGDAGLSTMMTVKVTKEQETVGGKDCYEAQLTYDPPLVRRGPTVTEGTLYLDKSSTFPVRIERSGTFLGVSYSELVEYAYSPDPALFPLEAGSEFTVTETVKTSNKVLGGSVLSSEDQATYVYEVESSESRVVDGETLPCHRVVKYDDEGQVASTMWISDTGMWVVEQDDVRGEVTQRLVSYSPAGD